MRHDHIVTDGQHFEALGGCKALVYKGGVGFAKDGGKVVVFDGGAAIIYRGGEGFVHEGGAALVMWQGYAYVELGGHAAGEGHIEWEVTDDESN